ncbi:50S ribosome-binding GTPase [Trichocoleus sp. Lan]|uniref:GTPase n=1 Tax=Trichocoleus sp. Lan TaxID=2933927 RepID=UPI0032980A6D
MEEIEFYYENRRYTCNISQDNPLGTLLIKNPEGAVLEITKGQQTGQKKTITGSIGQVDLSHPYLQGLISAAQNAKEKQIERTREEQRQAEQKKQLEFQRKKQAEEIAQKEENFIQAVEIQFEENIKSLSQMLKIAFLGKVSSGKSSLINAYLERDRSDMLAKVGAEAGITTEPCEFQISKNVILIDLPGLDDIRAENSRLTQNYLSRVDVSILVVTGAADASQKKHFNNLKAHCNSVFVVLNKIDEWDKLNPSALEKVINQWQQTLQLEKIYPCCANGYDPETRSDIQLDIRGVDLLRQDINGFLDTKGKKLLLAHQMPDKRPYAVGIIAGAVALVAGQAILPGRAAFITATQAAAIASLYYLYTGEILSKGTAFAMLPIFAGQAVASSVFLFVTSFIPPTGVIEVAAAITAASITIAMLSAVNFVLESGANIEDKELLKSKFQSYQKQAEALLKGLALSDVRNFNKINFDEIVNKFI